jgi:hypothetical protein
MQVDHSPRVSHREFPGCDEILAQAVDRATRAAAGTRHHELWRGQAIGAWPLVPKAAREAYGWDQSTVLSRLTAFASAVRNRLPLDVDGIHPSWEHMAVAQHLGLPTILLDVSTNPLVALWFAVRHDPAAIERDASLDWIRTRHPTREVSEGSGEFPPHPYILGTVTHTDPAQHWPRIELYQTRAQHPRITAQRGWFLVWSEPKIPLDRFLTENRDQDPTGTDQAPDFELIRYRIPAAHKPKIRARLAVAGFDECSLMPGMRRSRSGCGARSHDATHLAIAFVGPCPPITRTHHGPHRSRNTYARNIHHHPWPPGAGPDGLRPHGICRRAGVGYHGHAAVVVGARGRDFPDR